MGRGYINDDAFELPSNRSEFDLNDTTGQDPFEGKFARGGGGGDQGSGEYESVAVVESNR